ncbi:hypothetical protein CWC17_17170 [Pseudoalteromonas sp. S3785]|nr:hypothetical protein CWC17_17170 [Pseudoalteromonas sp. S3785]
MPEGLDKQKILLSSWSERSSATNWNEERARRARQAKNFAFKLEREELCDELERGACLKG